MALAYSAAVQTRVASLLGLTYSTTSAFNKTLIDGTSSTATPSGGCALDALVSIQQKGQWFSVSATTAVPTAWEDWLVAETAYRCAKALHHDKLESFRVARDEAESTAVDAYTPTDLDSATEIPAESYTLTMYNLLRYVVRHCVRQQRWETVDGTRRQKPRLWVGPEVVYAQTDRVLKTLWTRADWPFRRRAITLVITPYAVSNATYTASTKTVTSASGFSTAINPGATVRFISGTGITACERVAVSATANTVVLSAHPMGVSGDLSTGDIALCVVNATIDGLTTTEKFASVATREFCYTDLQGIGGVLKWADGTEMAMRRARDSAGGSNSTGRPDRFRFENNATQTGGASVDVFAWTFTPPPDGTYYATGEVYVKGPTVTTLAAGTADMARFPVEFDPVIKDMVLAEVMDHYGLADGKTLRQRTETEYETLLKQFCDVGVQDDDQEPRDVYGDFRRSRTMWPSFGQYGGGALGGGL